MSKFDVEVTSCQKVYNHSKSRVGLSNIDLKIEKGDFVSMIGPSGCGKSTLLRIISGLEKQDQGQVTVVPKKMAFVFQDPALLPWLSVHQNVNLPLKLKGIVNPSLCQHWIQKLGLSGFENAHPHELSGGMRMRVSFARALVSEPDLLLLDEPFAALDEMIRLELTTLLRSFWMERKMTTLFVTHAISDAVFLGDRILCLNGKPSTIVADQRSTLPQERNMQLRTAPEFSKQVMHWLNVLKGEV